MKALLLYLCEGKATSELTKEIDTRVVKARTNSRWEGEFMTLYERYQIERTHGREDGLREGREMGIQQGIQQGLVEAVSNILKKGISIEEACELVGISVADYQIATKTDN